MTKYKMHTREVQLKIFVLKSMIDDLEEKKKNNYNRKTIMLRIVVLQAIIEEQEELLDEINTVEGLL